MAGPKIRPSYYEPNIHLQCSCGWEGVDGDVVKWDVQKERDRVVRQCPSCHRPVPEWGTLRPIGGVVQVARGPLRDALIEAREISDEAYD